LVLWSAGGLWSKFDMLKVWQERAVHVKGEAFTCGHFLPEEDPIKTAKKLIEFFNF